MNKVYYDTKDGKSFSECIKIYNNYKNSGKPAKFVYIFHENDLLEKDAKELYKQVQDAIKSLTREKVSGNDFTIAFLHNKYNGIKTNTACKVLGELEKKFDGIDIKMLSGDLLWSVEQIVNANSKLDNLVEKIKSKNLSPVEQLMYAYKEVTKRVYTTEIADESYYISRDIYGVLNSDKIVCVGYSELFKEIVSRLELGSDAQVFLNLVDTTIEIKENGKEKIKKERHENCIVYIKDEKYGLDGYYYFDPTWDAQKENDKMITKFSYFLLPLGEIANMRKATIKNIKDLNDFDEIEYLENNLPKFVEDISFGQHKAKLSYNMEQFLNSDYDLKYIMQKDKNARKYSSASELCEKEPELFYSLLKQKSKTIRVDNVIKMIANVVKADNMQKSDEDICRLVQKIYAQNYERANEEIFDTKSLSYFSKHQNRTLLHDKNLPKYIKDVLQSVQHEVEQTQNK